MGLWLQKGDHADDVATLWMIVLFFRLAALGPTVKTARSRGNERRTRPGWERGTGYTIMAFLKLRVGLQMFSWLATQSTDARDGMG